MGKASDGTIIGAISTGVLYVNKYDPECGANKPCYESIQSAIDAASTGSLIKIAVGLYPEPINLDTLKVLTLQGGWNISFTTQSPNKTKVKAPTVHEGSLIIQMVTITP